MARFICLFLGLCLVCQADTNYVVRPGTPGVTPAPAYLSWATAATSIIDAVAASTNGNVIMVSNGTYVLTQQISVSKSVTIKGWGAREQVIVDGNYPNITNRCFYVSVTGAVIDGLTISNGYSTATGGGGIYMSVDSTVTNCVVTGCRSDVCGGGAYIKYGRILDCVISRNIGVSGANSSGGGVSLDYGADMLRCTVSENTAGYDGGGVLCGQTPHKSGHVIDTCIIISNTASTHDGGGIMSWNSLLTVITNTQVLFNQATGFSCRGGGIADMGFNTIVMDGCRIVGNYAARDGGGMYWSATNYITDCVFASNTAQRGGGVQILSGGTGTMTRCVINDNKLMRADPFDQDPTGGGLDQRAYSVLVDSCQIVNNASTGAPATYGPGIYMTSGRMRNCLIAWNGCSITNGYAGGMFLFTTGNKQIVSCTIVSNMARYCGGVYGNSTNIPTFINCIIISNTSELYGNTCVDDSNRYVYCCSPKNGTYFDGNDGNVTNHPLFIGPNAGNWRLAANSPCINAGTNCDWMTGSVDLDGRTRIRNGTVDMGCYEYINQGTIFTIRGH